MHLACPGCGFKATIEVFAGDVAAKRFAVLMGRVPPPLAPAVMRYLALFAPAKHAMTFAKGERVLGELVPMIEAGRVTRARREWSVSLEQWDAGLQAMNDKRATLTLPLKSHGYLLEVLAGAVDKVEALAEAKEIADQRAGRGESTPLSDAAQWDADRAKGEARVRAMRALSIEIAAQKRLRLQITRQGLTGVLQSAGHALPEIEFAFSKLPEPIA